MSLQNTSFVTTKVCLSQQTRVCRDKLVAINIILSRQRFCHGKHTFVVFCRDKHKTFVATKIIFMAAPANDSSRASVDPKAAVGVHSDVTDDVGVRVCIVGVGAPREFILHASTETSTASGNPDRGHSHPRQYDRNHRGTSRGGNSHRTRQKPPRDIQRGGTLILHDRNHHGTSREGELSSYTV